MHSALNGAPSVVRDKWTAILNLKGKRDVGINKHKREFLLSWVSDPTWSDAYFSQCLSLKQEKKEFVKGVWIPFGRLEVLLGEKEAKLALDEGWYPQKKGKGSQILIFYTEEGTEAEKSKVPTTQTLPDQGIITLSIILICIS